MKTIVSTVLIFILLGSQSLIAQIQSKWVSTWSMAPCAAENNTPPSPYLANNTLRQIVRISIGGDTLRVKFSNRTCATSVTMNSVNIAVSTDGGNSVIDAITLKELKFNGNASVTMKAYSKVTSDPIAFTLTSGMRGDGDEALTEETAIDLLKTIIADQRKILTDVTGKPAEEIPQVWALYKEVQDYYDKGMRVDDDILILFSDDNWGNIRILPKKEELEHKGGYGMYYHFDYVGGPVSYRWLNVTQIERVWEQMNLAYQWGVRDLWIVNVGDIKPMELPISFFMDFAWDPENIKNDNLSDYYSGWAKQLFGEQYAEEIAEMLRLYTKYNARRTPEMLTPDTYCLEN